MKLGSKQINSINKPSIKMLLGAAINIGALVQLVDKQELIYRIDYKGKVQYIKSKNTLLPFNTTIGHKISANKQLSKEMLKLAGIKTPAGFLLNSITELKDYLETKKISFPLVIKPNTLMCGLGVFANLNTWKEVEMACQCLDKSPDIKNKSFIAEEFFKSRDFRLLTLDGEVLAVMERLFPRIKGDGKSTIRKLIMQLQKKGNNLSIDEEVNRNISNTGYKIDDTLEKGKEIIIRYNANIATGGLGINVTSQTSDFFKKIAAESLAALGLKYGGVDIMTNDIQGVNVDYRVIEVNGSPDMAMHNFPHQGRPINVAPVIIKKLFTK